MKNSLWVVCLLALTVSIEAQVVIRSPEQAAYDQALLLAIRSERIHEAVKPVVVRAIVDLVGTSKKRPLNAQEKTRLAGLDALRNSVDSWVTVHNAYLDVIGSIEFFLEKSNRTPRDNARLSKLLRGLPRNNRGLEGSMENVERACRELGLKVEI